MKSFSAALKDTLDPNANWSLRSVQHHILFYYSRELDLLDCILIDKLIVLQVTISKNGYFGYSQKKFAQELRSDSRTINKALNKLEKLGLISINRSYISKIQTFQYKVELSFIANNIYVLWDKEKISSSISPSQEEAIRNYYISMEEKKSIKVFLRQSIGG